jgi:hypothetical protein
LENIDTPLASISKMAQFIGTPLEIAGGIPSKKLNDQ